MSLISGSKIKNLTFQETAENVFEPVDTCQPQINISFFGVNYCDDLQYCPLNISIIDFEQICGNYSNKLLIRINSSNY